MTLDSVHLLRRLNEHCAHALEAAAGLCQTRAHAEITVEHWLVKLLEQGDGDLAVLLRHYEIDVDEVWQGLLAALERLPRNMRGKPGLSRGLQELLQAAWLIASLDFGGLRIRSAHLYLALLAAPERLSCRQAWPLFSLSAAQLRARWAWLEQVSAESEARSGPDELSSPAEAGREAETALGELPEVLTRFAGDLTAKARQGLIDPLQGRDKEMRQMVDVLLRRRKNNPILVGEPGVGKTALAEGLALAIASGEVLQALRQVRLLALDIGLLQAGAGVKGEFEQRLKLVIEAVRTSEQPILLFIDEAHVLVGAGNAAGGSDAANLLKPALARGELRTIAATTWSEYKQYFEQDAALERRFQMVKVEEPDDAAACLMLRGLKSRYAEHHGVAIRDEAITAAVSLSRRYLAGRQLPDKAVDLIDTAAARARLSLEGGAVELQLVQARVSALDSEREALLDEARLGVGDTRLEARLQAVDTELAETRLEAEVLQGRYQQERLSAESLRQQCRERGEQPGGAARLAQARAELAALQGERRLAVAEVDAALVAEVIADWTGVPVGRLLADDAANLLGLAASLRERVRGQEGAVAEIAQSLLAAKSGLEPSRGPLGVFLLTGPSGVGKTETGLALADLLFGGEQALLTINLSEYQEAHTVSQLKGSPPGYVGYGQGGVLTEAVRRRPYSVILLDEAEKAHRDVLNLFYQAFDRGFMRDGEGREIDFRNTLFLLTSNLGSELLLEQDAEPEREAWLDALRSLLLAHFQAPLLARMQVVPYGLLSASALAEIAQLKLTALAAHLKASQGMVLEAGADCARALACACGRRDNGARGLDHLVRQQLLPEMAAQCLQWRLEHGGMPARITLATGSGGELEMALS
ncbi:type VI secretion system ATPase TssH [Chromobacterium aquaticum]|uniref:Type VI secretion system ATPase TssH n=1 Tax=Chromobacterium aquaticum TaxID=467180 RepID=A0ABV8ZXE4_9NEIS|nr:type VI secretion system ATPase TssH [Chromobacterium aquaticum]MCD5361816.1 type VI secretion system ATPase TssH [Chromobacterium aquaticum]